MDIKTKTGQHLLRWVLKGDNSFYKTNLSKRKEAAKQEPEGGRGRKGAWLDEKDKQAHRAGASRVRGNHQKRQGHLRNSLTPHLAG